MQVARRLVLCWLRPTHWGVSEAGSRGVSRMGRTHRFPSPARRAWQRVAAGVGLGHSLLPRTRIGHFSEGEGVPCASIVHSLNSTAACLLLLFF
jgi:hypothetical protein